MTETTNAAFKADPTYIQNEIFSGPYSAEIGKDGTRQLRYFGHEHSAPLKDVYALRFDDEVRMRRMSDITTAPSYQHLHEIDNAVFFAATNFFRKRRAHWCNLPLTTLMISSPGEVYAGKTLDYTTDTLPVDIRWFDHEKRVFLSESSQFYLELRLLVENVDEVFCIYNSFRKEHADFSHLSEFQHIEFEGHVGFEENIKIAQKLLCHIVEEVIRTASNPLSFFLSAYEMDQLAQSIENTSFEVITFKDALKVLLHDTGDNRYKEFSLRHFGAWEEVRLTQILKKNVWVSEYPLLQIPFYHNEIRKDVDGVPLAENADLILHGYREVIGSGTRITCPRQLAEKAKAFNLPPEDYQPYLETRGLEKYKSTSGFGLGWQRLTHWMLKLPAIWHAVHIPRGHTLPIP